MSIHKNNETNQYLDSKMRAFEDESVQFIKLPSTYHTVKNFQQTVCQYLKNRRLNKLFTTSLKKGELLIKRVGKDKEKRQKISALVKTADIGHIVTFDSEFRNLFRALAHKQGKSFKMLSQRGAEKMRYECVSV